MGFSKQKRDEFRQAGICIRCGKELAAIPHTRCQSCHEYQHQIDQKRQLRLKGQLLCNVCGNVPPLPRLDRCQACTDIAKARQKARYHSEKRKGICMGCRKTGIPLTQVRCDECQDKANIRHKARFEKLKAQGLCSMCGKYPPEENRTECTNCLQRGRENNARIKKQREKLGLCKTCGKSAAPGHKDCDNCLRIGREAEAKKRLNHPDQKIRERDGFKCRVCGSDFKLIVHHINGNGRRKGKPIVTTDDDTSNLITLCDPCHYRIHKIARYSLDLDLAISLIKSLV